MIERQAQEIAWLRSTGDDLGKEIEQMRKRWQEAERDRAGKVRIIAEMTAKLEAAEADRVAQLGVIHSKDVAKAIVEKENSAMKQMIASFRNSISGRLLSTIGVTVPTVPAEAGDSASKPVWLPGAALRGVRAFRLALQIIESRQDLNDVRNYNRQMLEILASLRPLSNAVLLDVGASPHGIALQSALQLGVAGILWNWSRMLRRCDRPVRQRRRRPTPHERR